MTLPIAEPLRRALSPGASVLLALSGGVDSALALAILSELGCDVRTVTFKNFCYGEHADPGGKSCCSLEAIEDARALAHRFGARHWVTDVSEAFRAQVIAPFVQEYRAARTPNPCLACNSQVRFPHLLTLADRMGCDYVATGHYARTDPIGGDDSALLRGVDIEKDQAYFLARVPRRVWSRVVFPLGWATKPAVREAAHALGLPVASKPESQEICFVPTGDRSFLFADDPASTRPGPIVDRQGRTLGEHRGLVHYTVGQRRGLQVAAAEPLYVLALERGANRLVVGRREELAATRLLADDFVAAVPDLPTQGPMLDGSTGWTARIRHRHAGVPVQGALFAPDGTVEVTLAAPVHGAAPGQAVVLYDGDRVLGGGRLVAARP